MAPAILQLYGNFKLPWPKMGPVLTTLAWDRQLSLCGWWQLAFRATADAMQSCTVALHIAIIARSWLITNQIGSIEHCWSGSRSTLYHRGTCITVMSSVLVDPFCCKMFNNRYIWHSYACQATSDTHNQILHSAATPVKLHRYTSVISALCNIRKRIHKRRIHIKPYL